MKWSGCRLSLRGHGAAPILGAPPNQLRAPDQSTPTRRGRREMRIVGSDMAKLVDPIGRLHLSIGSLRLNELVAVHAALGCR
jgi:hypothetical protein